MSTQMQFLYGLSIQVVCPATLSKLRTKVMQAAWATEFYSMSPHVTLALLLPVQCDPFFAHEYSTLRVLYRYATNAQLQRLQHVAQIPTPPAQDGPARVIHSILNGPLAEPATRLLQGNVNDKEQCQHDMREAWRQHLLLRATQRTHYAGVDNADRHRTLSYLEILQQRAQQIEVTDIPAQLAILRRALAGGLLTEDRITQHKQKAHAQDVPCECGHGTATVLHYTWTCPKYSHLRQTFLQLCPDAPNSLPMCTQYSGIIVKTSPLSLDAIAALHQMFIDIWQCRIRTWYGVDEPQRPTPDPDPHEPPELAPTNAIVNGHLLAVRPQGGYWCQRCGKCTSNAKHLRLKITKTVCAFAHLSDDQLLAQEGHRGNPNLIAEARANLERKYNVHRHQLVWNEKFGKIPGSPEEGLLHCTVCNRRWKWKDRINNLPRQQCAPANAVVASASSDAAPGHNVQLLFRHGIG